MLGIKQVKVVLKNDYTMDTLYEAIKDHEFTPGKPQLVKHGFTNIICFEAIDGQNQVQIVPAMTQGNKPGPKWTVMKAEAAGMDNLAKNMAIGALTNGWGNLGSIAGKNSKLCEKQVEAVANELKELGI